MSAEIYGSVNGVTRKAKKLYANVNGVTRGIKELWANVNGVTRKIYSSGAKLSANPYINSADGGYSGVGFKISTNYSSVSFSNSAIDFDISCKLDKGHQRTAQMLMGVTIPVDLGKVASFSSGNSILRLNKNLFGYSGNNWHINIYDSSNDEFRPDSMNVKLTQYDLSYVNTSGVISSGDPIRVGNYEYRYDIENAPITSKAVRSFSSQYVYINVYFTLHATSQYEDRWHVSQFNCTIPEGVFTIIDSSGNEYPVNFSF